MIEKIDYIYREFKKFFGLWQRPFITFCKDELNDSLIGCEIGVFKGNNSLAFLHFLDIRELHLIDVDFSPLRSVVYRKRNIFLHECKSSNVFKSFPDFFFDFIYIDGNHSFESCLTDLMLYYPKLKHGGVIGGHDFSVKYIGVIHAVLLFAKIHDIRIYGDLEKEWYFVKPR